MDYSKLSDADINGLVMDALSDGNQAHRRGNGSAVELLHQVNTVEFGEHIEREEVYAKFDPCNNPADAWPIISANRISVEYDSEHQCDVPAEWVTAYGIDDLKVHVVAHQPCDKALRSAMIVFLMMQELANVPANSTGSDLR
ncbi:phage protein NinX family protein [Enterobacter cloacae]|uniref:phage protein NinX family protein n=1 Tax=Enterobacter cloacae TaxID=550 RepID=UPI002A801D79|nr:phage protein NinX family protein [Enterobacter cloacae]